MSNNVVYYGLPSSLAAISFERALREAGINAAVSFENGLNSVMVGRNDADAVDRAIARVRSFTVRTRARLAASALRKGALAICLAFLAFSGAAKADDCGAAELAQARADAASGARLLASDDPVRSLFGWQLLTAAFARRDAAVALCAPSELDASDPWDRAE